MKHPIGGLTDELKTDAVTYPELIEEWDEESAKWKELSEKILKLSTTRHSFGYLAVPESVICD